MSKIVAKPTGKLCTFIPSSVAFEGISNKKNGSTRDDVPARNILEIGGITGGEGEGVGLEARGMAAVGEVLRYLNIWVNLFIVILHGAMFILFLR